MDAKAQLRRYLEQRREMGETELVLDTLGVDDALKLLGVVGAKGDAGSNVRETGSVARDAGSAKPAPSAPESRPPLVGQTPDWRDALRAAGAAPQSVTVPPSESPPIAADTGTPFDNVSRKKQPPPPLPKAPEADASPAASRTPLSAAGDSLEKIASDVTACTRCPLRATATHPVPGEGNPNADFMCVGEAPGATEDETGRPFVGAAGQLLTKILEAIQLPREQVFICNVLKHRPPGNRNPLPEEVIACSPYLIRQIELVKPKVILALGSFAAQTLLQSKLSLGKLRGSVHQYHGVPVVVTYHPAALLRNPEWKRPTWEDVQLARRILDNANQSGA